MKVERTVRSGRPRATPECTRSMFFSARWPGVISLENTRITASWNGTSR